MSRSRWRTCPTPPSPCISTAWPIRSTAWDASAAPCWCTVQRGWAARPPCASPTSWSITVCPWPRPTPGSRPAAPSSGPTGASGASSSSTRGSCLVGTLWRWCRRPTGSYLTCMRGTAGAWPRTGACERSWAPPPPESQPGLWVHACSGQVEWDTCECRSVWSLFNESLDRGSLTERWLLNAVHPISRLHLVFEWVLGHFQPSVHWTNGSGRDRGSHQTQKQVEAPVCVCVCVSPGPGPDVSSAPDSAALTGIRAPFPDVVSCGGFVPVQSSV